MAMGGQTGCGYSVIYKPQCKWNQKKEDRTGKTAKDGTVLWESEGLGMERGPCGRVTVCLCVFVCVIGEGVKERSNLWFMRE